ncbi:Rcn1 [Kluyveromyces lactis]|nr:Rcn1 [Kluyveromyces lactis]
MATYDDFATDTVIITSKTKDVCSKPLFDEIVHKVQECVVNTRQIYGADAVRVITLPGFKRILVTSPNIEASREVKSLNPLFPDCKFGFSITNHVAESNSLAEFPHTGTDTVMNHLKVPPAQTLFLVSPPASPPPGFDYSRLEEWPNRNTGHEEAGAGIDDDSKPAVRKVFDNGHTRIIVEGSTNSEPNHTALMQHIKTAMPPISTFDDVED